MSTATVATAPTVEIGYAQQTVSNWWLYDPNETTPELQWPMSVYVYDQMRRQDAQVTSVLRAVTLPVRRTPWRIDPNGARDEVVQFVADDLGLPIVGQNPEPPPRSKDRFSWPEHLRQALLMLPFGHMYFEIVFRVDPDGSRAHLRKLAPRMPRTIERIDVADDGGLISISQYWMRTTEKPRPIPVDRLVAYVHELEGGNWLGTSILRPAYKNWLLKDRLLRVQAQTIERNGMGIPLYKAQEGATPTDMASGLAMATAWRAGDAAGSATPFGADLVLRGVEGTLPDAEPAIRYHDEQIARAVLAHFLNLGTQTGSWALGTTFADFFTLSLQTLAQQIADTATCHIVEDMVDINFGPDEPAPRVTFDEIGSRQAATAAAIKTLVDAGVIRPDQVLEESSRQQYGLPPADPGTVRQPPAPAPAGGVVDPNAAAAQQQPFGNSVAASVSAPVEAGFNPDETRIPGGPHGGEWGHGPGGVVKDALKLAGRIDLNPGESLVSSRQLDFSQGAAKLATTNHGVRLGLGGNAFAGDPWRAANKGLTVKLSPQQVRDVADGLDAALKQAKAGQAAADRLWEAADAAQGTTGHAALLKKAQDAVMGFAQPSGTVPGEWGSVHIGYSVTDTEPAVWAAVRPTNAPPDWDLETAVDEDAGLRMDPAEAMQLRSALPATRVQADAAFESKHHRGLGGKFATMVDRLINAIAEHKAGGGKGHPFDGFDREQLRRAAVKRGITLKRGEDRDSIAAKLLADLGGPTGKPKAPAAKKATTSAADVRRVGQDLIVKDMSVLADHVARDQGKYQSADGALSAIAHEQGFDGKPRVATKAEIDKLVAGGAHETFRGVGSGFEHDPKFPNDPKAVRRITAAQVNDQLRTGDAYYGVGIYGNGYYFTSDQSIAALDYSDGSAGSVVRAVLPKDAKIADTHTLQAEQAKFHMAETGRPGSNAYKTYGDLGRYAAARGYDALRHEVGSTNPPTYNYVILNRSALVVQEG